MQSLQMFDDSWWNIASLIWLAVKYAVLTWKWNKLLSTDEKAGRFFFYGEWRNFNWLREKTVLEPGLIKKAIIWFVV